MPPSHDERVEVRVSAAELDRWRRVASGEGLALSEWLRKVATRATSPSPVRALFDDLREHIERHYRQYPDHACILSLTSEDELTLLRATRADLGDVAYARLLEQGPRDTFRTLLGARVEWNQKHRGSRPELPRAAATEGTP